MWVGCTLLSLQPSPTWEVIHPTNQLVLLPPPAALPGELFMLVRQGAAAMHDRDRLLDVAFEGVGSLPMAVIDRYRQEST